MVEPEFEFEASELGPELELEEPEPEVGSIVLQLSVRQLHQNKLCEEAMERIVFFCSPRGAKDEVSATTAAEALVDPSV